MLSHPEGGNSQRALDDTCISAQWVALGVSREPLRHLFVHRGSLNAWQIKVLRTIFDPRVHL